MLRRILIFIAVLAVPLSLIAVSALPARADETPPTLSPAQGPPGTKVTASATDWPGCSSMSVSGWGTTLGTATINSAGAFSLSFTVPSNAPVGATQLQFSPTCTHSTYIPFVTFTVTTRTSPVPVITSVGTYTRGVLVYFDIHYADPGHDAVGFGFVGVNGSGWAEENHPFSSPSYGIVGPDSIAYPFNEACGTAQQYASYVEAWIYDTAGNRSTPVVIHLVCTTTPTPTWSYQAGNYAGKSGMVSVVAYKEPNFTKYDDYCGPGASQVLISAWTKNVPSIDTLATEEKTDPNPPKYGTYISDMVKPINDAIGTKYYNELGAARTQADLSNRIGYDILHGHPLITGIKTGVGNTFLNGWDYVRPFRVNHIITIYGFDFSSPTQGKIYYVETSSPHAGTNAAGPQEIDYQSFWILVQANNDQLSGAPA